MLAKSSKNIYYIENRKISEIKMHEKQGCITRNMNVNIEFE